MKAWVLVHSYYDDSGFTVVRVYLDPQRAQEDIDLVMVKPQDRWELKEVDVVGEVDNDDSI